MSKSRINALFVENETFAAIPIKFEVFWDIILFRVNITAAVSVDLVVSFWTRGSKLLSNVGNYTPVCTAAYHTRNLVMHNYNTPLCPMNRTQVAESVNLGQIRNSIHSVCAMDVRDCNPMYSEPL